MLWLIIGAYCALGLLTLFGISVVDPDGDFLDEEVFIFASFLFWPFLWGMGLLMGINALGKETGHKVQQWIAKQEDRK